MPHPDRYFVSSNGQLKRKNKASIVNKKIYEEFTKHATSPHEVVAYHINESGGSSTDEPGGASGASGTADGMMTIKYLDSESLRDFLYHEARAATALALPRPRPTPLVPRARAVPPWRCAAA